MTAAIVLLAIGFFLIALAYIDVNRRVERLERGE